MRKHFLWLLKENRCAKLHGCKRACTMYCGTVTMVGWFGVLKTPLIMNHMLGNTLSIYSGKVWTVVFSRLRLFQATETPSGGKIA